MARRKSTRAFSWRGGVRLEDTHLTCDAAGSATDLVFLSHARAVGPPGKLRLRLRGAGRQELLTTPETLALLGRAGETLRKRALPAPFGRSFVLGDLRLVLAASGHLPGAASLLCETGGRRLLYAGTVSGTDPVFGADAGLALQAESLCLDATFGDPRFVFPPRPEALARVRAFVDEAIAGERSPVLLVPAWGAAMDVAHLLAEGGMVVRGHRMMVAVAAAFRAAGVKQAPVILRFDRKLAPGEVLLWPPEGREAPLLGVLRAPVFLLVSGFAQDPEALARVRPDAAVALSNHADYPALLAYIATTGARELALVRGFRETLADDLARRGYHAYPLGPPRQMELFAG